MLSRLVRSYVPWRQWLLHMDLQTGKRYYHNARTQETRWHKPQGFVEGWVRATDPQSGKPYYYNNTTLEHQWEEPPGFRPQV